MKIYTKTGDKGETSLIGGKRVRKFDDRIEAYGTLDELIAFTGLLRDQDIEDRLKQVLLQIQDRLMVCAAILATDSDVNEQNLPLIYEEDIQFLETEIDTMENLLAPLQSFILPGGHQTVSLCHITRTICRRAERLALKLNDISKPYFDVIKYLNRLSDYFFVLSRKLSTDLQVVEHPWLPRL